MRPALVTPRLGYASAFARAAPGRIGASSATASAARAHHEETVMSSALPDRITRSLLRQLDTLYCDANHDLVADSPTDPKRLRDPSTLVWAYTPV